MARQTWRHSVPSRLRFDPTLNGHLATTPTLCFDRVVTLGEGDMKIEGSCHCGQVTFEAETETNEFGICHCSECQTLTGTAFNTALPVSAAKFVLLSGTPRTYVKTAEQSGRKVLRAFCGNCGSPIYRHSLLDPSILRIGVGSIKQRRAFTPVRQIWKCSALAWVDTIADLPTSERNPENINLQVK